MKILGIESAALVASVAILDEDITIAEYTTNFKKTHSETLLPMLDEIIKMTGIDCSELSAIAVSGGPGSFTGLRIGAACAKGLGLALDLPLIHVPTLDAMALNIYSSDAIIVPIMDARRNQVYTGIYKNDCNLEIIKDSMAVAIDELFEILKDLDNKEKIKKIIFLEIAHDFAPANLNRQRASNIAMLGLKMFKEGKSLLSDDMRPEYLRKSQAERERNVDKTDAGL